MQPNPMADTSRLLFPSLRFCISELLSFQSSLGDLTSLERDCRALSCSTCRDIARKRASQHVTTPTRRKLRLEGKRPAGWINQMPRRPGSLQAGRLRSSQTSLVQPLSALDFKREDSVHDGRPAVHVENL